MGYLAEEWQKRDFDRICNLIDAIKTPKDFYRIIGYINDNFNVDIINAAREAKQCYNSAQYM